MKTLLIVIIDIILYFYLIFFRLKWLKAYLLIAASLKGVIYGIDARNGNTLYRLTGHTNTIYDCKLIDGTSTLATTSEDGTVKIFNIPDTAEDMN